MRASLPISAALVLCAALSAQAADDYAASMQSYNKAVNSTADAHAVSVYSAWADDMERQITSGRRKGKVIGGDVADPLGIGNVVIEKGAKIAGPIIVKPEVKNSTVIFHSPKTSRF